MVLYNQATMTKKEIEKELTIIYEEMRNWRKANGGLNYVITKDEVERRELILIAREELYRLENAKKSKNKLAENAHEATVKLIKATLNLYQNPEDEKGF
jgi:hypothetical protein